MLYIRTSYSHAALNRPNLFGVWVWTEKKHFYFILPACIMGMSAGRWELKGHFYMASSALADGPLRAGPRTNNKQKEIVSIAALAYDILLMLSVYRLVSSLRREHLLKLDFFFNWHAMNIILFIHFL